MFNRTSDQQTLHTLRALHNSGILSGSELDDQLASDLLNSSVGTSRKNSFGNSQQAEAAVVHPPVKKPPTPSRLEPLQTAATVSGGAPLRPADGSLGPLSVNLNSSTHKTTLGNVSAEYIKQLQQECEQFNTRLSDNTEQATEKMQKLLAELFVQTAKERLPDCFLRSLPKFGKQANKMAAIFSKSVNKKKTDNVADRKDAPFELDIQADVMDDFSQDIEKVISEEMTNCFGSVSNDLQRILKSVLQMKDRLESLEEQLLKEQTEMRVLKEKLNDGSEQINEVQDRMEQLLKQSREKDIQMDILSDQVKRRNLMLDEQRGRFHKEVIRYKTKIYELKSKLASALPAGAGDRRSSLTGTEMDSMIPPANNPAESVEVMEAVETATRELREQMLENIRKLKAEHSKEKKELLHQKKIAMDERDNEIYHLKMNMTSMDRIIEVEKRRLVKHRELELKEIQEKYEQKISALTGEIQQLKSKYETQA